MRKTVLFLLAASAMVPTAANAQRDDRDEARAARAERQQAREAAREERRDEARAERAARAESRRIEAPRSERQVEFRGGAEGPGIRAEAIGRAHAADVEAIRAARDARRAARAQERGRIDAPESLGQGLAAPSTQRQRNSVFRDRMEQARRDRIRDGVAAAQRTRAPVVSSVPREGTQPPLAAERLHRRVTSSWGTDWRRDRRYDWRDYRRRNSWRFNLGYYYDPFGWRYRPYSIGWRMWPSYYSSRYWLNDPWMYRLPHAPAGYRWVRYWDDAILVDTWTGEVVDVIHNFFW